MRVVKGQDGTALRAVLVGKLTVPRGCHHCPYVGWAGMLCILPWEDSSKEGWGLEQKVSTGIPHIAQDSTLRIGFFTPSLLDVVAHCVIMTSTSRAMSRPVKSFPGRQKQVWVCLVIPVLTPLGIFQPLGYECQMRGAMAQIKFCSHPVSEGVTLFGNKSLTLHPCPHFFIVPIFCCPFHLVLENPRVSKPSQQHSLKFLGGEKTPQSGVSPRENHGYSVVSFTSITASLLLECHSNSHQPRQRVRGTCHSSLSDGNQSNLFRVWGGGEMLSFSSS